MNKYIYLIIFVFSVISGLAQNYIVNYEYWFDGGFANRVTTSVSPVQVLNLNQSIPTAGLQKGLHVFHIRFKDQNGLYSSPISQHFYISEFPSVITNFIDGYRFWVDGDTSALTTIDIPVTTNPRVINDNLNMTEIDTGYHIVSLQFRDLHGLWSSPVSDTFYRTYQEPMNPAEFAIRRYGDQLVVIDPIQLGTGTYTYNHTDFKIPVINNKLEFTRFYNSLNNDRLGPIGYGWSHSYDFYIVNNQDTAWIVKYPDGHVAKFIPMNNQGRSFPVYSGTLDSLNKNSDKSYSLYNREKMHYHFDPSGKLDSIIDLNGNATLLYYSGTDLDSIVGPGGRTLRFIHTNDKLLTVQDPLNRTISYDYDVNDDLVSVTDAENHTTNFTYDSDHRLVSMINALGDTIITNNYNTEGKVVLQTDAYQEESSIEYDTSNPGDATVTYPNNAQIIAHHDEFIRKTLETDELGFTKQFSYDSNSNETGYINENDYVVSRIFDNWGNMLSDTLPDNKITNAIYNSFNSPIQITDANGNQKFLYYNSINNNLDSIRFPDNSLNSFQYDSLGQLILMIDGNDDSTQYTYSVFGNLLSITTFSGMKQFTYDEAGRKISSTDENGSISYYTYDDNDNVLEITDPLNRTVEYTYDSNNQLLSIQNKKGFITSYIYDKKGRKISETNPKRGITTYTYDIMDNLISKTDPTGNIISYTYDLKNRKIGLTNALGTTQYQYDPVGNLIKIIDPENVSVEYSFTGTNKKVSQKDGLGNVTEFAYDNNDNQISVTDPKNRVTNYGYAAMNRLITVIDALNNITSLTYDYNGNKTSLTDPNGHTQLNIYDASSRLINTTDASGNEMVFEYDSIGNITGITKPTGTITKDYDRANRVINIFNSSGDNYTFEYDDNDNITSMSNNTGTSVMTYDSLNNLVQYQDPYGKTISYEYDKIGRRSSITYPGNKTVLYSYDDANNLSTVTDWLNQVFTYAYDKAGRNSQLTYPNGTSCKYEYDQAGRLISRIYYNSDDKIISGNYFTLDETGNRISDQAMGEIPSVTSSTSRSYSYEDDDRMLSDSIWTFSNDNSGNRIGETNGSVAISYTFSVDNLLTGLTDTSGTNYSYNYNPLGHRLLKTDGTVSTRYVLDISTNLSKVLQITDENGTLISDFVHGLGLLEKIDASGNPFYYHFDAQHNTYFLTDQNAATTDTYAYDPFGTLLTHTGASDQSFTFLGEFGVEQESPALYYIRARYYDSVNGRFLSKDTYEYDLNDPQSINRYVYGLNNSLINYDPSGLFSWSSAGIASLQLTKGLGNVARGTLGLLGAATLGPILGPSSVLSAGNSFNEATKDFKAFYANLTNPLNSNDNWVLSDDYNGVLDFAYEDPLVNKANSSATILLGLHSLDQLLRNTPKAITGILSSNYSDSEKLSFLLHYIIGKNSPILDIADVADYIKEIIKIEKSINKPAKTENNNKNK